MLHFDVQLATGVLTRIKAETLELAQEILSVGDKILAKIEGLDENGLNGVSTEVNVVVGEVAAVVEDPKPIEPAPPAAPVAAVTAAAAVPVAPVPEVAPAAPVAPATA